MAIQAVIFDIEGVLLRKVDSSAERKWEDRLDLEEGELSRAIDRAGVSGAANLGKVTAAEAWKRVGEHFGLNDAEVQELEQDIWSGYELNHELADFLQGVRSRYKTATVSNGWSNAREVLSRRFGIDKLVDTMIISSEVGLTKIDARLFQLAMFRLNVWPEDTIFVDDDTTAFDSAWLLGMKAVQFKDNEQAIAAIQKYLA
ncbi:MAG TPA: HAD-IA family hydrolase [Ktedonobacteraceae bacterium]|nr:HAD-IA family hydrolase [Ktedonobacteraceae bacterium]